MALTLPDTVFEANFFDSLDGQNWTDLSSYVEANAGINISRRRQLIFDEVSAGSFSIYLDNSAGTFNNDRTDLPYAGLIGIDVPVRMRARWPNVPSGTVNMISDNESAAVDTDYYVAEQGTLDVSATVTVPNQGTPANTGYFILSTADAAPITVGSSVQVLSGAAASSTVYTVTSLEPPFAGFVNVHVSPSFGALPGAGDSISVSYGGIVWSTGTLASTGIHLLTGDLFSRSSDDVMPVYVTGNTQYTAGMLVKDDSAGTGISFKVSATILWYDYTGALISESVGSQVTLTTSFQTVSVTATSPANAVTARMSLINQTVVNPATAAITLTGFDGNQVNNGARKSRLTIPTTANVGDLAVAYHKANNTSASFTTPAGWTALITFADGRGKSQIAYKILTQADIGQPVFWDAGNSGFNWTSILTTWSGVNSASPINVSNKLSETALTNTHVTPAITTTVANALILSIVGDTSNTTSTWSLPGTDTFGNSVFGKGGNATTGQITYRTQATAGTTGTTSFVSNVKSQYAFMATVALAPATGTGPGNVTVTAASWQMVKGASLGTLVVGGHWKALFTGLTDSWTKTFQGDLSLMQVQATDASKTLSANVVQSATYESITAAGPIAYYPLNESGDQATTQGANVAPYSQGAMTVYQFSTGGTLNWGNGTGPAVDGQAAVTITKSNRGAGPALKANLTNPIADSDSASISLWFNSSDSDASGVLTMAKLVNVGSGATQFAYIELRGTSGTNVVAAANILSEHATYNVTATYTHNIFDGKTHLLNAVAQLVGGALNITLYVDGVQQATANVACPLTMFPVLSTFDVGNAWPTANLVSGTFSHAAAFNLPLDGDTIADMYVAGTTAYAGDTVDQRIGRIAAWSGLDALTLDTSTTICDRHMPDSQSVLSAIQQAARTDGGTSYVADDGSITFKSRTSKEDTASAWLTINVINADPSFSEVTDDQLLVNQVVVNMLGANTSVTTENLISQTLHGIYNKPIDTIMQDRDDADNCGNYYIAFYSTPSQRCDQVVIEARFLNQWQVLLTQDMWDLIHFTNLPSIEASSTLDLYIEGWGITITDESWQYTFDTSTAIPFAVLNDSVRGITGNVVVAW